jgi:hypothetical protein
LYKLSFIPYGSFTLAKFVNETVNDSDMLQLCKSHLIVTTVLALATLCGTTKNRNDPISVMLPRVAKASTSMSLLCVIAAGIIAH